MRPRGPRSRPLPSPWPSALALCALATLAFVACKGRKSKKTQPRDRCSAASLEQSRRWLTQLCAADAQRLKAPSHHWWGLPLARGDVELVRQLPGGVLLTLTPKRLLINGRPAPDWPKPATWQPPDMSMGPAPVITRLLPVLRKTLGASATISTAKAALDDLERRASPRANAPRRGRPGPSPPKGVNSRPPDLPSGLTVVTLVTAKAQLAGRGARLAHLAIGPRVTVRHVIQLQALLALAGFDGLNLLFTPRSAAPAPAAPLPRALEALGTIGPAGHARARRAARLRAVRLEEQRWMRQGCDAMRRLRATLAQTSLDRQCQVLQDRLPDTFRQCRCNLDERPLLTFWLAALSPMDPVGIKPVRLHPRGRPLRVRANAIWTEIAEAVVARKGRHLWLALDR